MTDGVDPYHRLVSGDGYVQKVSIEATQVALSTTLSGTPAVDTELPAAAALADATANPTAPAVAAHIEGYNGATWDRLRADTTSGLWVNIKNTLPTTPLHGVKAVTTAGTAVALAASAALTSGVRVKASATNTGTIYVGVTGVTSANGYPLAAGEEVFIEVANIATIYLNSSVSAESAAYIGS